MNLRRITVNLAVTLQQLYSNSKVYLYILKELAVILYSKSNHSVFCCKATVAVKNSKSALTARCERSEPQ